MKSFLGSALAVLILFGLAGRVLAHPIPDVPVRSHFDGAGNLTLRVEVDTRAYLEDPNSELYMLKWYHDRMTDEEKAAEIAPAQAFVDDRVQFQFEPTAVVLKPIFKWEFAKLGDEPLVNLDDPVVLIGEWSTPIPKGSTGYQVIAKDKGTLTVLFENFRKDEKLERFAGLWPAESSFVLDLATVDETLVEEKEEGRKVALIGIISVAVIAGVIVAASLLMMRRKP